MHYEFGHRPPSAPDALFVRPAAKRGAPETRRILIIEDDPLNRKLFRDLLSASGYEVRAAADGLSGLALCREVSPDLVLLDVQLPGLGGIEVARALSNEDNPPKIIAISAFAGAAEGTRLREAGCLDRMPKPIAIVALLARIDEALGSAA